MTLRANGSYIGPRDSVVSTTAASGVWDLRTAQRYQEAGTWPRPPDPYFANVALLLHMDGANGSTTFSDSSSSSKVATRIGNAVISTVQSKFGGSSLLLNGSGDYVRFADSADFAFGSGPFTVEAWVRLAAHPSYYAGTYASTIVGQDDGSGGASTYGWNLGIDGSGSNNLVLTLTDTGGNRVPISAAANLSLFTWYHIAAVRDGNTIYLYKDGVLLNSGGTSYAAALNDASSTLKVGALDFDGTYKFWLNGNIDELRITKGVARYPGGTTFTPPTAPYPDS